MIERENKEEILKRIQNMDHITFWCYNRYVCNYIDGKIESYYTQDITEDNTVYWSDLEKIDNPDLSNTDNLYLMHDFCQMGDYGGSLVEKTNTDILTDEYGFIKVYGGYGSISCMIQIDALLCMPEEESDRILEVLEGLSDYPLIDDEELSNQESEQIDEAWDNWTKEDFIRSLCKKFNISQMDIDEYDFMNVYDLFIDASEKANEYWINESGYDMWINVDKVSEVVTYDQFLQYFKVDE